MVLALLALGGLLWWMANRGKLLPSLKPAVARAVLIGSCGLLFIAAASRGEWFYIVAGLAGLLFFMLAPTRQATPVSLPPSEALAVLGLDSTATAADVQAAWRRLIAQVHPDHGGSAALASRVTAARDVLLARLEPR